MPEQPEPKTRQHPWRISHEGVESAALSNPQSAIRPHGASLAGRNPQFAYAELSVLSNFSFLRGASHPDELVQQAAALGHCAVAITDINTLAGIVRAHVVAKEAKIGLVVGCRLRLNQLDHQCLPSAPGFAGGPNTHDVTDIDPPAKPGAEGRGVPLDVLVYPTDRAAYGRLCRLLTLGKRRAPKGQCHLTLHDLIEHSDGLLAAVVPPTEADEAFVQCVRQLKDVFDDDRLSIAASCLYGEDDREHLNQLAALAEHVRVPLAATNAVHYHRPERRALQDVLTCIRCHCTVAEAGRLLHANAERHLKLADEMARLFAEHPEAIARSVAIVERAGGFSLDELRYEYPDEVCPPGLSAMQHLIELTRGGADACYPNGVPAKVQRQIDHELELIDELNYAPYFLTVHDLVVFARSRGILCQGRGAAANSAVCYFLGVTAVDPDRIDLLFERFVSKERNEPPDIDIDFEHERREEVIQYIYNKYGRDRAALTAEVITYRGRSAVREVGKALGLSLDCVDRLAKNMEWWQPDAIRTDTLRDMGLNPNDPTLRRLSALLGEILGFPRHLSQHVGGFVITRRPLCEMVPVENAAMPERTVIEWDKDDIDAMGMLKVDCLGLGMMTCIGKCLEMVNGIEVGDAKTQRHGGTEAQKGGGADCGVEIRNSSFLELHTIPPEDPRVYDMICNADTIGVFQVESRAQMSMLPRLRPRCYYDLVIEVAIVRPGPIQGDMVHPYLRRRNGEEPVTYPDAKVKRVLGKTLGVPLFQEQAMQLAIVAAGFTPGEADQLRRAIAAWKTKQKVIFTFGQRLIEGMTSNGYPREFAERCFRQIQGFSEYGFPESHAASFALLVYVSAWLKCYYPAAFAAALLNSQPMGFYAPAQIVRDAIDHGVEARPVDANESRWDCGLEEIADHKSQITNRKSQIALRLGMRQVKGLRQVEAEAMAEAVERCGRFASIESLWRASGVRIAALRKLANADGFGSMGLDRQAALWQIRALRDDEAPLFGQRHEGAEDGAPALPEVPEARKVIQDYASVGLSLKAHPVSFIRHVLEKMHATPAEELADERQWPHGKRIAVAGTVLVRQRPGTASGIIFMTIEDETGIANLIVRPSIYERCRRAVRSGVIVLAHGIVERQGQVVHVQVQRICDISDRLQDLLATSRDFH